MVRDARPLVYRPYLCRFMQIGASLTGEREVYVL